MRGQAHAFDDRCLSVSCDHGEFHLFDATTGPQHGRRLGMFAATAENRLESAVLEVLAAAVTLTYSLIGLVPACGANAAPWLLIGRCSRQSLSSSWAFRAWPDGG